MTISLLSTPANYLHANGAGPVNIGAGSWPDGSGGGLLWLMGFWNVEQTPPTPSGSGWSLVPNSTGWGGSGTAGEDTGPRGVCAWFTPDGSKTTETWNQPSSNAGNSIGGYMVRLGKTLDYWSLDGAVGADSASGANFTATLDRNPGSASGDMVFVIGVTVPSATTIAYSLVWTGSGLTSLTSVKSTNVGSGHNLRPNVYRGSPTGAASAIPTVNGTADVTGAALLVRVSETNTAPNPHKVRTSGGLWVPATRKVRSGGAWV